MRERTGRGGEAEASGLPGVLAARPAWLRYGVAAAVAGLALGLTALLAPSVQGDSPTALFFAAVLLSTRFGGLGPGLLTTALSALLIDQFVIRSGTSLALTLNDAVRVGAFALVALLINSLVARRQRLEADLRTRAEQLAEAGRRKDEFLATLAHELRNPLGSIRNAVPLLRNASAEQVERVGATIDRQVGQMARLIDDLLDASRFARGRIELQCRELDLGRAMAHAVETARPPIDGRGHTLAVSPPSAAIRLRADPTRLEQVLVNLLNNAARYTEPGGRIELAARREGEQAVIRVRDTGVGIAPEVLPLVFDLFMQADRSRAGREGLGIGLSLVRSLVELHGGTVEALSPGPGRGSEFIVRLPALPPAAAPANGHAARAPATLAVPAPAMPLNVLLVDDNLTAAATLADVLRAWGHTPGVVHAGRDALALARDRRPDVVLLDLALPDLSGLDVARQLRREPGLEDITLVAVTGYSGHDDAERSRAAGFDHHFSKPLDLDALERLLARLAPRAIQPTGT